MISEKVFLKTYGRENHWFWLILMWTGLKSLSWLWVSSDMRMSTCSHSHVHFKGCTGSKKPLLSVSWLCKPQRLWLPHDKSKNKRIKRQSGSCSANEEDKGYALLICPRLHWQCHFFIGFFKDGTQQFHFSIVLWKDCTHQIAAKISPELPLSLAFALSFLRYDSSTGQDKYWILY